MHKQLHPTRAIGVITYPRNKIGYIALEKRVPGGTGCGQVSFLHHKHCLYLRIKRPYYGDTTNINMPCRCWCWWCHHSRLLWLYLLSIVFRFYSFSWGWVAYLHIFAFSIVFKYWYDAGSQNIYRGKQPSICLFIQHLTDGMVVLWSGRHQVYLNRIPWIFVLLFFPRRVKHTICQP